MFKFLLCSKYEEVLFQGHTLEQCKEVADEMGEDGGYTKVYIYELHSTAQPAWCVKLKWVREKKN